MEKEIREPTLSTTIHFPVNVWTKLEDECRAQGIGKKEMVIRALQLYWGDSEEERTA